MNLKKKRFRAQLDSANSPSNPNSTTAMPPKLLKLAALYRAAHLFAQQCHWIVTGPTFAQDHAFFSDLYTAYAEAVDDLVEKAIGTARGIAVYDGAV